MSRLKTAAAGLALGALFGFSLISSAPPAEAWTHCFTWRSGSTIFGDCDGGSSRAFQAVVDCSWGGLGVNSYRRYGTIARYDKSKVNCAYSWDRPNNNGFVKQFSK